MIVTQYTQYSDNPYTELMYSGIRNAFEPVPGSISDAARLLGSGASRLLHINWEEHAIRHCRSAIEAELAVDHILVALDEYRKRGGMVIWTVHNVLPHELEHAESFVRLRRNLVSRVDRIIIHTTAAASVLAEQTDVDASLLYFLPHPSYLGVYERASSSASSDLCPSLAAALAFGKVRAYKGYDRLLRTAAAAADDGSGEVRVRVVGEPLPGDDYAEDLRRRFEGNDAVEFDYRRVPNDEVAQLVRRHACLVLAYERSLTSGVALLGVALGVPIVAPDSWQMRETLPRCYHRLLFDPDDAAAMLGSLRRALRLDEAERAAMRQEALKWARYCAPQRVSRGLGACLRSCLQVGRADDGRSLEVD